MSKELLKLANECERMAGQVYGEIGQSFQADAGYYRSLAKKQPSDQITAIKLMIEYRKQGVKLTSKQARKMMGEIRRDALNGKDR